jgi:hypothetical protein
MCGFSVYYFRHLLHMDVLIPLQLFLLFRIRIVSFANNVCGESLRVALQITRMYLQTCIWTVWLIREGI